MRWRNLTLSQKVTLFGAVTFTQAERNLRLADVACDQTYMANRADPYVHEMWVAWDRITRMYVDRLVGRELGRYILDCAHDGSSPPSWVIKYLVTYAWGGIK